MENPEISVEEVDMSVGVCRALMAGKQTRLRQQPYIQTKQSVFSASLLAGVLVIHEHKTPV